MRVDEGDEGVCRGCEVVSEDDGYRIKEDVEEEKEIMDGGREGR